MAWNIEQAANDLERYVLRKEPPAIDACKVLIDHARAVRTCNPVWKPNEWGFANAYCECGELLLQLLLRVPNGIGEALPNYCPNCGAKVVGD